MGVIVDLPLLNRLHRQTIEQRSIIAGSLPSPSMVNYFTSQIANSPLETDSDFGVYSNSEVVYRCVQIIGWNLAQLDIAVLDDDGELSKDNDFCRLFNKSPNADINSVMFKALLWTQLECQGQSFVYVDRDANAQPIQLINVTDPVVPLIDNARTNPDGTVRPTSWMLQPTIIGYWISTKYGRVAVLPEELLWLRYPHPANQFVPFAPWRAASWASGLDNYARQYQAKGFREGGPDVAVYLGDLPKEDAELTRARFKEQTSGGRRIVWLTGTAAPKVERLGLMPTEMSFIDSHKINREDIALAFGVPFEMLMGQVTYENRDAADAALWTSLLLPKARLLEAELDKTFFPEDDLTAVFDTSAIDALKENEDAKQARVLDAWLADAITLGETRKAISIANDLDDDRNNKFHYELVSPLGDTLPTEPVQLAEPRVAIIENRVKYEVSHERIDKAYDRHETALVKITKKLAAKQEKVIQQKLKKVLAKRAAETSVSIDDIFDLAYWVELTTDVYSSSLDDIWTDGGLTVAAGLGVTFDQFDSAITAAMEARLTEFASQITDTTQAVLEAKVLSEGVAKGESVTDLAARVTSVFDDLSTRRAETIARTETHGGFNASGRIVALETGVVIARIWDATNDNRVRETHRHLDGHRTKSMTDAYPNGLLFPGDPKGKPEETINCRCVERYVTEEDDE